MALSPASLPFGVNFPAGVRFAAGCITPSPTDGGWWPQLWKHWDWSNWIRPQIDCAAAIGLNTVRVGGSHWTTGTTNPYFANVGLMMTEDEYFAKFRQFCAYVMSRGMHVGLCEEYQSVTNPGYNTLTRIESAGILSRLVAALEPYWECIYGLDMDGEWNLYGGGNPAASLSAIQWGNAPFRATASIANNDASTYTSAAFANLMQFAGYIDIHYYPYQHGGFLPLTIGDLALPWSYYPDHQIVIGETGMNGVYNTDADRTTFCQAAFSMNRTSDVRFRGTQHWALNDQDPLGTLGGNWGVEDQFFNLRSGFVPGIIRGTSAASTLAAPGTPVSNPEDHRVYSNPLRTCDTYDHMKVYRNGTVLSSSIPFGRYDDSTEWSKRQRYYQFSVVNAASSESALSAKTIIPQGTASSLRARGISRTFR